MKILNKKSQAAVEYLQTYSWAILLIVILGVALWQLGIFSAGPKANVAEGFKKIKVLEPSIRYAIIPNDPSPKVTNLLNFTVMNTGGTYIHDLTISVEEECTDTGKIGSEGPCVGTSFMKDTLGPSETTAIKKICCDMLDVGDFFYVDVSISYTQRIGEIKVTKTEKGVIKGYVEVK